MKRWWILLFIRVRGQGQFWYLWDWGNEYDKVQTMEGILSNLGCMLPIERTAEFKDQKSKDKVIGKYMYEIWGKYKLLVIRIFKKCFPSN